MKVKYYFLFFASPFVLNKLKALSQTSHFPHVVKKLWGNKGPPAFVLLTDKGNVRI